MLSLSFYCLISSSLLFSSILKLYIANEDVYEAISVFLSNQTSQFLLLNLIFAVTIFILQILYHFFFGHLLVSQWSETIDNMYGLIFDFSFITPTLYYNHIHHLINGNVIIFPVFSRFLVFLVRSLINGFDLSQSAYRPAFHVKIFILQVFILLYSFSLFCFFFENYIANKNPLTCILSEHCGISFCCEIGDIIKHFYFVYDINNPIQFPVEQSIKFNYLCDLTSELFSIISESIIECTSIIYGLSAYVIRPKTIDIFSFTTHVTDFKNWIQLSQQLKLHLPNATAEDIQRDDCCIICRLQMHVNDDSKSQNTIKKLPCGHCYHQSCLQQWIMHQKKCPLCQYDLKQLIEPHQRPDDDDTFNFGVHLANIFDDVNHIPHEEFRNEVEVLENNHQEIINFLKEDENQLSDSSDCVLDPKDNVFVNKMQNAKNDMSLNEKRNRSSQKDKNLRICPNENASYESFDNYSNDSDIQDAKENLETFKKE